jgi:hypothetical protein
MILIDNQVAADCNRGGEKGKEMAGNGLQIMSNE